MNLRPEEIPLNQFFRNGLTYIQIRVKECIENLSSENLTNIRKHPRRGELAGWEILIIVARHATEHMGQAKLTRDLLFVNHG